MIEKATTLPDAGRRLWTGRLRYIGQASVLSETNPYRYAGNNPIGGVAFADPNRRSTGNLLLNGRSAADPSTAFAQDQQSKKDEKPKDPGAPSLPTATEEQKKEAGKFMKDSPLKLNPKDYTIQGPLGGGYACDGLVVGAVTGIDWKDPTKFPGTLPLKPKTKLEEIDAALKRLGAFSRVADNNLKPEDGKQKVVVIGTKDKDGTFLPRHYALQLRDGNWLSKLGIAGPTIIHSALEILMGDPGYGEIIGVYIRPNPTYKK